MQATPENAGIERQQTPAAAKFAEVDCRIGADGHGQLACIPR
jgi:hypothetical protein